MIKMMNNLEPDIMCRRITGVDDVVQISLFCVCYLLHLVVWYIVPRGMVHLLKTWWDSHSISLSIGDMMNTFLLNIKSTITMAVNVRLGRSQL